MSKEILIEVLGFEGCPNVEPTLDLIHEVLAELKLEASVNVINVASIEDAKALRFLGSPSVRVNGIDIEAKAQARTDFAYCCRIYDTESGSSGVPLRTQIEKVLLGI